MSGNDTRPAPVVPLFLVQFIDRTFEAERKMTEAEFRRRDAALEAHIRMNDLRQEAGDAKMQKADAVLEYRLKEMNNFRAQINQERTEYLRREMFDREHSTLSERVKSLEIERGEQSGKAAAYASMIGFVVVLVQIALHFVK
ncbi:MAG: hypothetical protein WBQ43_10015 [Terriglobales bacterium]